MKEHDAVATVGASAEWSDLLLDRFAGALLKICPE